MTIDAGKVVAEPGRHSRCRISTQALRAYSMLIALVAICVFFR